MASLPSINKIMSGAITTVFYDLFRFPCWFGNKIVLTRVCVKITNKIVKYFIHWTIYFELHHTSYHHIRKKNYLISLIIRSNYWFDFRVSIIFPKINRSILITSITCERFDLIQFNKMCDAVCLRKRIKWQIDQI